MPIELTGRCRVSGLREGAAREHGTLRVWQHAGRESGAAAISLRVLELAPGRSPSLGGVDCDEVLYVFEGAGALLFEGVSRPIGTDVGFYVPPGARYEIEASTPMTLVSSRCPDPGESADAAATALPPVVVRLDECISETTGDRWYSVLLDHHIGRSQVTQFVGAIPPGRAPDHYIAAGLKSHTCGAGVSNVSKWAVGRATRWSDCFAFSRSRCCSRCSTYR